MNLAFCLYKYFPFGGLQRDFLRIAQECLQRGHTVDVYTSSWEGNRDPRLSITFIPSKGLQNHTRCKKFAITLQKHLQQQKYDAVIGFNKMPGLDIYYAADTCFQTKSRQKHGLWYQLTPRYRHQVAFEKAVFDATHNTQILLLSQLQQKDFTECYGTAKERFHLLPPVLSKERVLPDNAQEIRDDLRHEFQMNPEDHLLLMIGSGFKTKGLDRILKSIASLPSTLKRQTKLFVIGQDRSETFRNLAKQLQIQDHVIFLGGRKDIDRFLLGADLLLHPAYNENTGTVLLEALVYGLPVLTTDVCGYASYVQQAQAGCVLPSPFQQSEFNNTLKDMLLSPKRTLWQQNAIQFTQQADIYSMAERAVDIIETLR